MSIAASSVIETMASRRSVGGATAPFILASAPSPKGQGGSCTVRGPAPRPAGGAVIWLTGLSGAGKSTLANALHDELQRSDVPSIVLDGDVLRAGLCRDLGFSVRDRRENVRRAAEAAIMIAQGGAVAIVALISPFRADRDDVARGCRACGISFADVFVNAPLAVCERRDPKQLYRRARAGEIPAFTGITSPYEPPTAPALEVRTDHETVAQAVEKLMALALTLVRGSVVA